MLWLIRPTCAAFWRKLIWIDPCSKAALAAIRQYTQFAELSISRAPYEWIPTPPNQTRDYSVLHVDEHPRTRPKTTAINFWAHTACLNWSGAEPTTPTIFRPSTIVAKSTHHQYTSQPTSGVPAHATWPFNAVHARNNYTATVLLPPAGWPFSSPTKASPFSGRLPSMSRSSVCTNMPYACVTSASASSITALTEAAPASS